MPRNKISNNLDHVRKDLKPSLTLKERPLDPWPLPTYIPVNIINPRTHDQGCLLNIIASDDLYTIFNLFFTDETIQILVNHINKYGFHYFRPKTGRKWFLIIIKELQAYLGVNI